MSSQLRTRWAAIGAAIAISLGAGGGFGLAQATIDSGERNVFVPITPCRLTDTRPSGQLGAGEIRQFTAHGSNGECTGIPTDAVALSLNVTTLGASEVTFLTIWPDGALPNSSSLNPAPGQPPIPNAVITPITTTGTFNVFNAFGTVHTIIDINGYYADHTHDGVYVATADYGSDIDVLLDLIKDNTDSAQANEDDLTETRTGTIAVNKFDFHPVRGSGDRNFDKGVYVPSGSSNSQLWAPVQLPFGATVTGIRFRAIDNTLDANLKAELRQVAPNGFAQIYGTVETAGLSPSSSVRQSVGVSLFGISDTNVSYEVKVTAPGAVAWKDVNTDIQLVGFFIDYEYELNTL